MDYGNEIKTLMTREDKPCVSLYLPLSVGNESVQAKIALKALLREAEDRLLENMRRPEVEEFLAPTNGFVLDSRLWEKHGSGLAVFIAPGFFKYYTTPVEFQRSIVVGDTFHITPMLQLLNNPGDYYVLDIDLGKTRLFYGTEFALEEIELLGTPLSLEEAMQYDDPERQVQFHTNTPQRVGDGRRSAQFHGHGGTTDYEKNNILRFYQQLDTALQDLIRAGRTPVVLGGAEYLTAIYREASDYPFIASQIMSGSLNATHVTEIRKQAWEIAAPHYREVETTARDKYQELLGTGLASKQLEEVILACYHGRVETLFVALDMEVSGAVDLVENTVQTEVDNGDDLLNLAATQAVAFGGTVFVLDKAQMPDESLLAAVYRF